jgi:EAL domain-containing protein (putative c-di-GMP-specific phosphodiesterase class I)
MHGDLRHALARGELSLHYQPLVDLPSRSIESVEALLRWKHPTRGFIPPDEFIPIAEETGLIAELGRFVLREACAQTAEWQRTIPISDLRVSVNVSPLQLYDATFIDDVRTALDDSGLSPENLILELTESTLLSDTATVHGRLDTLKQLGVQLAIDDFGTGYSSLAYLRSFPVDYLKIDRSFISELGRNGDDEADVMVRSIISIGHNLKLGIVAEGIEEQGQLDEVHDAGCDTGQGFLFARPGPPTEIADLLRTNVQANAGV